MKSRKRNWYYLAASNTEWHIEEWSYAPYEDNVTGHLTWRHQTRLLTISLQLIEQIHTQRDSILLNLQHQRPFPRNSYHCYSPFILCNWCKVLAKSKKAEKVASSFYFYILQLCSTAHHLKSHQTYQTVIKVLLLWITVCPHLADSYVVHKFSVKGLVKHRVSWYRGSYFTDQRILTMNV